MSTRIKLLSIVTFCIGSIAAFSQAPGGVSSDLQLWLKADEGTSTTTNGADVTSWGDQSANAYSATIAVTGSSPDYDEDGINFNPGLMFNGSSNGYDLGSDYLYSTNDGIHVFVVTKPDATTAKSVQFVFDFGFYANNGYGLVIGDDDFRHYVSTSDGGTHTQYTTPDNEQNALLVDWEIDFGTASTLYQNGVSVSTSAITTTSLTVANINESTTPGAIEGPVMIGRQSKSDNLTSNNGRYHDGTMAEVIMYDEDISDADKRKVESYLAVKYGITLGSTANTISYTASEGTVFWTANATYQNDVTGVGRDDDSELNQLQSASVNTDDIVTMGLGEIASTNLNNTHSFASDLSFMMWGNDNDDDGTIEESTSETPLNVYTRLDREWLIEEIGTVGDVDLEFDLSSVTVNSTQACEFHLLIDTDGDSDFTSGAITRINASSFAGNIVSFNNVDFSDGDVFTLSTSDYGPGGVQCYSLWLKADFGVFEDKSGVTVGTNPVEDGDNVNSWFDLGMASDAIDGGSSGTYPEWVQNGVNFNPSIYYTDDGDRHMKTSVNPAEDDFTLIGAFVTEQSSTGGAFWGAPSIIGGETHSEELDYGLVLSNGQPSIKAIDGANGFGAISTESVSDGASHMALGTREKGAGADVLLYTDGLLDASSTTDNNSLDRPGGIGIANHFSENAGAQFEGHIPEVTVYQDVLTAIERIRTESYLAVKYGFTLGNMTNTVDYKDSDNNTIWTGDPTYQNDVAGIGRDDASNLEQKQSLSTSSDAILTIGNTAIDSDNTTNTNSFTTDQSFLIWGNDNGDLVSNNTTDVGTTVNIEVIEARMSRVWKSQETGVVGSTKVRFDLSGIGGVSSTGDNDQNQLRLLVDQDGVFAAGATSIAPSLLNNTTDIIEFDHDFATGTGFFFTIGSLDTAVAPLPVRLVGFDGRNVDEGVVLEWMTASEENHDYFEIQESNDGINWVSTSTIYGIGINGGNYELVDLTPSSYYRLVQFDYDGEHEVLKTIYLQQSVDVVVHPNPTTGVVYIEGAHEWRVETIFGAHLIQGREKRIDLSAFAKGVYIVKADNNTIVKLVKE